MLCTALQAATTVLTSARRSAEELARAKAVLEQVEYYFSDENLPRDAFMLDAMAKNGGSMPVKTLLTFHKMKKFRLSESKLAAALRASQVVVVHRVGKRQMVRRRQPLPLPPFERMVQVENIGRSASVESLTETFQAVGTVESVTVVTDRRDRFAKVTFASADGAAKAVQQLNNDSDWRSGLRVFRLDAAGRKKKAPKRAKAAAKTAAAGEVSLEGIRFHRPRSAGGSSWRSRSRSGSGSGAVEKRGDVKGKGKGGQRRRRSRSGSGSGAATVAGGVVQAILAGVEDEGSVQLAKGPDGSRGFTLARCAAE
eukprot:PLAT4568.2.p1 GENE.PLAT4568.2~~PLAT4568.2.p1  ORF type:complete len:311 (+),score=102.83 PLAT4568.2:152-1084(+)